MGQTFTRRRWIRPALWPFVFLNLADCVLTAALLELGNADEVMPIMRTAFAVFGVPLALGLKFLVGIGVALLWRGSRVALWLLTAALAVVVALNAFHLLTLPRVLP